MEQHPIEGLMKDTMENIKDMIDVNTIVGDAIESQDGSLIVPISKVSFGFVSGGSEFAPSSLQEENPSYPFGGGSSAGVSVKPVAFLVIQSDCVRLLPMDQNNGYDRIIDSIPQVMDMVKNMIKGKKSSKEESNCCKTQEDYE